MKRRYLIDGYNLLHAIGLPKKLGPGGLQLARERLLARIKHRLVGFEVTVVFDSRHASRHHGMGPQNGLSVIFSKGQADDLIHDLVHADSVPASLCVVSSDHAVQDSARRRHAQAMDADRFLDELDRPALPPTPKLPEKPATSSDEETLHWLDAFASIDTDPTFREWQRIDPVNPDPGKKKRPRKGPKKDE